MKILHSRSDLIALADNFCPTAACRRCLGLGDIDVYGLFLFQADAPHGWAGVKGWILRVNGIGTDWLIAIRPDPGRGVYLGYWPELIPWVGWQGESSGPPNITNGDNPKQNAFQKMKTRRMK